MTLKIYTKAEDVPEGLRSEYKQSGSQWVPDLSEDHPVLVLNKTLIQEKGVAEAKVKKLSTDLDDALEAAKTSGIPRGQTLVAKADAEALTEYKALGTPADLKVKVTEHGTLTEQVAKTQRDQSLRQLAKDQGYNEDAFIRLPGLPEFTSRAGKDGKTEWFAQLKDEKGVITEKPAKEFVESSEDIKPFMPSLTQRGQGVQVPGSVMVTNPVAGDPYTWAKEYGKNYAEQAKPVADPFKAFSERSSV